MLVQKVAPTADDIESILSLSTAKTFASVIGDYDDETITELIQTAIEEAQEITNRQFAKATYELILTKFTQNLKLPKNPIQEVLKIEYMDKDGVYKVLDPSSYFLHEELEIGVLIFSDLPGVKEHPQAVKITFTCGYSSTNKFPFSMKQWLKVRVNTLYEHRENIVTGTISSKLDHVDAVLDRYRIRPS